MKITKMEVTKIELTELDRLDPVQIIAEDLQEGWGRLTISCFGKSWTNTWGGMGPQTIIPFLTTCHVDYLAEKLGNGSKYEINWNQVADDIKLDHWFGSIDETTAYQYEDELIAKYGDDWRGNLPNQVTSDYAYLCRIIEAVQDGLIDLIREEAA